MRVARSVRAASAAALLALATPGAGRAQVMNETCTAVVLNRTAPVTPDGMFVMANVPLPIGSFRARVVCAQNGQTFVGATEFVQGVPNGVTNMGPVAFGAAADPIPVSIEITSPALVLTPEANGAQLVTTGTLVDGTEVDFTLADTGTSYTSSNPNFATVSANGFVNGLSSGTVTITAVNEGVIATIQIRVEFEDDADGDGMPDDFERNNAVNPGGANLSRIAGAVVRASSESSGFAATRAVDGNLRTSWFTNTGDAANRRTTPFIEVELPSGQNVAQVRVFGNRERADGFDFFAGRFFAFDAAGVELFNSGRVVLPPPNRDLSVPIERDGVRRVRFVATEDESPNPGLAELELISRPGGPGLDPVEPGDAALDFDGDTLTNLDEFQRGTSIFLNDTDGDRVPDAQEIVDGSDPVRPDTDNDGLLDGEEVNPLADTDADGQKNLLDPDSDGDGILDGIEVRIGLDPTRTDSNANGVPDNAEDTDGDGIPNLDELAEQLDPGNPDSDGDGLRDGEEVIPGTDGFVTDPLRRDSDGDGMPDGFESLFLLNPTDPGDADDDPDADGLSNLEESQLDTDPRNPDRAPPNVLSVEPPDEATGFPINGAVVIRFSEAMRPSSFTAGTVRVLELDVPVAGTVTPSADGLSVTVRPGGNLATTTAYTVVVSDVRDAAGNLLATRPFSSSFTTSAQGDLDPPSVARVNPEANADGVPVNSVVQIEFDEPIDPATVTSTTFRVTNNRNGAVVTGTLGVDPSGTRAFFTPAVPLAIGSQHRVAVTNGVRDVAGNALSGQHVSFFTTGFAFDGAPPVVLGTDPADEAAGLPINTVVTVDVNEPLDPTSVTSQTVALTAAGVPVPASLSLLEGGRRVRLVSSAALTPSTAYRVTVQGLRDLAANTLAAAAIVDFTTATAADITRPTVTSVSPPDNTGDVVRDVRPVIRFSEPLNPLTVSAGTFRLQDRTSGVFLPVTVALDASRQAVTVTPSALLEPDTQHMVQALNGVADTAGNTLSFTNSFFFTTGQASGDATAPTVVGVNPPDGTAGVPLNTRVVVQLSEPIDPFTLTAQALQLRTGGTPVAATFSLGDGNRQITLVPAANLAIGTQYALAVSGLTDLAGNPMTPFGSAFFTSPSGVIDNTGPSVVAIDPPSNATGVSLNPTITVTFNEPLNPVTVNAATFRLAREVGQVQLPITVTLNESRDEVTIVPGTTLQPQAVYRVQIVGAVRDVAGNQAGLFSQFTTTAGPADAVRPTVALVTPADDTTDVAVNTSVVVTFSEPIEPATLNGDTIALVIDGAEVGASILRSADNTVVVLDPFNPLPAGAAVTLIATEDVRDVSGNRLVAFTSDFTVETAPDRTQPAIAGVRPPNGATDVSPATSVVLFFSEPVDHATAGDAVIVADEGVRVTGTLTPSSGNQVEEFTPATPFTPGALADVFVTPDLADTAGNRLAGLFRSSFRLAADPAAQAPTITAFLPSGGSLPRNVPVTARFSEPMDPTSFTPLSVLVRNNTNGLDVSGTMSLDASGTLFRFVPTGGRFPASSSIGVTFTVAVRDVGGTPLAAARGFGFGVGTDTELVPPTVTRVSPPAGATGVGTNAVLRLRFSEPLNALTVDAATITLAATAGGTVPPSSISLSDNDQFVTIVPHAPLQPATSYTIAVGPGVTDRAGNPVVATTSAFVTGPGPDLQQPQVTRFSPTGGSVGTNPVVVAEFSEAIDPATVRVGDTFRVIVNATAMDAPGTATVEPDGRRVTFTPTTPLHVGTLYRIIATTGIEDPAGNRLPFAFQEFFTTGFAFDTTPPAVVATQPVDGDVGVATTARVDVVMSEPVDPTSVTTATVALRRGGTPVTGTFSFSDGNRRIRFVPVPPLAGAAVHQLEVSGLRDVSGNAMTAPVLVDFTTGPGADLVSPTIASVSPADGSTDVPRAIRPVVRFSEPLSPITVNESTVLLRNDTRGIFVPVSVTLDATRMVVTLEPEALLEPGTQHRIQLVGGGGGIADAAGNLLAFTNTLFFTTGQTAGDGTPPTIVAVNPANGLTSVPVNVLLMVRASEPLDPVTVTAATVNLRAGATPVTATRALGEGNRLVTLTPSAPLAAATTYTLTVDGITDVAGNPIAAPFVATFQTSVSGNADNTGPGVVSVNPANQATGVALNPIIVLTFSEALNPLTVTDAAFRLARESGNVQLPSTVSLSPDRTVVTLTPGTTLQPNTQYRLQIVAAVRDLAGNQAGHFSQFTTGAGPADTTRPTVVLATPADGATAVAINTSVVVTFSEPVDPNTVTTETIGLVIDAAEVSLQILRSADNTVAVLDPFNPLPAGAVVSLLVTDAVRDLSGNRVVDFLSTFTVEPAPDLTAPTVAGVRPPNGATGVAPSTSVVLYFSEPITPASATTGVLVADDGALRAGTRAASSANQAIEFTPDAPFTAGALAEVFVTPDLTDAAGNQLSTQFQSSFRLLTDPATRAPDVTAFVPQGGGVARNVVVTARFSEPMDASTFTGANVVVRNNSIGQDVAGTRSLDASGTLFRFVPSADLPASQSFGVTFTVGVRDLGGTPLVNARGFGFSTGAATETTAPTVVRVSPPDGATDVGTNAVLRIRISEPTNPITVDPATVRLTSAGGEEPPCTISLAENDELVTIVPHGPLAPDTVYTIEVAGLTDRAGNVVVPRTTTFRTGAGPDLVQPTAPRATPGGGAEPLNPVVVVDFSEPVDPATVRLGDTFRVVANNTFVDAPGTVALEPSGRRAVWTPSSPLLASTLYRIRATNGIEDLAGNRMPFTFDFFFTTGTAADGTAPTVVTTDPTAGDTSVPTNAVVTIQLSEPVDTSFVDTATVALRQGATPVPGTFVFGDGNRRITFVPRRPMASSAAHSLTLTGLRDPAGNVLAAPVVVGFTTGAGADLANPTITGTVPANSATNVPRTTTVRIDFDSRLNPITANAATFRIRPNANPAFLDATVTVDPTRTSVTITPAAQLLPNTLYRVDIIGGAGNVADSAGNPLPFTNTVFLTTGP